MVNQVQDRDIVINQNQINSNSSIEPNWNEGKVLDATVVSNGTESMIIEIQGIQYLIKANENLGNIGNQVKLEVKKTSNKEVHLKVYKEDQEVRSVKQYDKLQSILKRESIPISEQNLEIAQDMIDNGIEVEKEVFEKVISTKQKIDQIIHTMTKKEVKELLESPYDVEKISVDIIARFLSKNDQSKELVSKEEIEEELKKFTHSETNGIKKAIQTLLENGLPVTGKNIYSLLGVQEKIETIKNMDDKAVLQAIKKDLPFTINNLYASIFSSGKEAGFRGQGTAYEEVGLVEDVHYEVTEEEIKTILKHQQISTGDEYINAARLLIDNNTEIDKEKIENIILLKKEIKDIDETDLLDRAAQLLKENKNPGKVALSTIPNHGALSEEELKKVVREMRNIDDEAIKRGLRRNLLINLKNLQNLQESTEDKGEILESDSNFITVKRQLEEVRLKMTLEAARRLNQKLDIDTAPLKQVVKELKVLEKEYYGDCLKKAGAEPSKENIDQLEDLYKKIEVIKDLDEGVLPKVIRKEIEFRIYDLYTEQMKETDALKSEAALSKYGEMGTKPDSRFGDTINKIEDQIEPLLKEQGINLTKENIRSARILIQNNIEVTDGNITYLKALDNQVNYVGAHLHPAIAAEMIKEGFRPDQIPINEVIEYINQFDKVLGEDVRGKLNEFILQMDEEKTLNNEQREGMIGIYRMLHTIEKSNGKAIGWLMKNDMSFTLNNLMEGAKYLARTGGNKQDMDFAINDNFGVAEERIFHEKSIRSQLEKAFHEKNNSNLIEVKENYYERIFEEFTRAASPNQLKEWVENPNLLETDLEDFYSEYIKEDLNSNSPVKKENIKEFLNTLGDLKSINQETLIFMEKNQIPMNINNLEIVSSILQDPFQFGDHLEEFNNILKELNIEDDIHNLIREGIEDLKKQGEVEEVLDKVKEKINKGKDELLISSLEQKKKGWKLGTDIEKIIDIQKQAQDQDGAYQIPILLNGKITNMNLYFMKDRDHQRKTEEKGISAFISMKTENMGNIQMYIHMDEKNVDFNIRGENKEITRYLKTQQDGLYQAIKNLGCNIVKGQFKEDTKENSVENPLLIPIRKHLDAGFEIIA